MVFRACLQVQRTYLMPRKTKIYCSSDQNCHIKISSSVSCVKQSDVMMCVEILLSAPRAYVESAKT